jgi:hypothetical protein
VPGQAGVQERVLGHLDPVLAALEVGVAEVDPLKEAGIRPSFIEYNRIRDNDYDYYKKIRIS